MNPTGEGVDTIVPLATTMGSQLFDRQCGVVATTTERAVLTAVVWSSVFAFNEEWPVGAAKLGGPWWRGLWVF